MRCLFEGGAYLSNNCNLQLKSLLHLGQNAITFRTLLHLGPLHLQRHPRGMAQTVKGEWIHDLIKRTPPRFGQFFIASFKKEKNIYTDKIQSKLLYETLSSQTSSDPTAMKKYNDMFNIETFQFD